MRLKPYTSHGKHRLKAEIRVRRGVVRYVRFRSGQHVVTVRQWKGGGFVWKAPRVRKVTADVVFSCGQRVRLVRTRY